MKQESDTLILSNFTVKYLGQKILIQVLHSADLLDSR